MPAIVSSTGGHQTGQRGVKLILANPDAGHRMRDTGCGTPDAEHRMRNTGCGTPDAEHRMRNTECGTPDAGPPWKAA